MSAPPKKIVVDGGRFRLGQHVYPGAIGPGTVAFNELVMPYLVTYLGGTAAQQIVGANFVSVTVDSQSAVSAPNSEHTAIKKGVSHSGKVICFASVIHNGYKYGFRLNQDALVAADLIPKLTATTPAVPVVETAPPPVQKVEPPVTPTPPQTAKPAPQPVAKAAPTPKPAPAPALVVEEPAPTPAPTPVEAVAVAAPVSAELEPAPVIEAPAPVVAKLEIEEEKPTPTADPPVEEKSDAPASEPPAQAAPRKSTPVRKTPAPEKKAASAKKKPPTKRPAIRKAVAKKPEPKSPALPKTETRSRVSIKPEVTDLDREIAYKAALLAELQQLREDTLAKAAEIEKRLAQAHGQKH